MKRKPILYAGAFGVAIVLVASLIRETARSPIHVTVRSGHNRRGFARDLYDSVPSSLRGR